MKIKLPLIGAALATSLIGTSAFAQTELSAWDSDSNGNLSLKEWDAGLEEHGLFDTLDDNANGIFDIDEAVETEVFEYDLSMDLDDGGHIERQEFTVGTFNKLDSNSDDMVSQQEFSAFSESAQGSQLFSSLKSSSSDN